MPKGNWHPSITSHGQKMIRQRDHDSVFSARKQKPLDTIDITKSDWSNRRGRKGKTKVRNS